MDHDNPWLDDGDDGDDVWPTQWPTQDTDWDDARQEEQRVVPPELLDVLLSRCHQVVQEIWPPPDTTSDDTSWKSGFDDLKDVAALVAHLLPADQSLPPPVLFPATATAKAMNDALKLTRNLPASANSPLSRLLASKGSLDWQKSIRLHQDVSPDTAPVGWRVLDKQDRLSAGEDLKPKKPAGGLLSFWNRRVSSVQPAQTETPTERSISPARSSLESAKSVPRPPSPPRASTPSVPPPSDPSPTAPVTAPAPSAVSRFLNRFSRAKSAQHSALALSSDDLEFLSDIVPSASDPPDEDVDNTPLGAFTGASTLSPLPPKLPPPPKQPILAGNSSRVMDGTGVIGSTPTPSQGQGANQTPSVLILAPPLSPKPVASLSHTRSLSPSQKDVASGAPLRLQLSLSPHQKATRISIPPRLPPPISPPQTPRPGAFPTATPIHSSTLLNSDTSSHRDPYESDEEFSAFTSFPPSAPAPFPTLDSYPQRSPSPPSPPPRRTYERTHYPSSSSASSMLSPASQSSADQLWSAKSSISASLDSFDDFVSPPSVGRGENGKHTPSPPPLPAKPPSQHRHPPRIDMDSARAYHSHTPSQTFASPTAHTSLMTSMFSIPSVSDAERQRAQALVDHAAARGGSMWPNLPEGDEPRVKAIPPPPSFVSPKLSAGGECFDLLGDGDILGGGSEASSAPVEFGGIDFVRALHAPFGVAGGPGKGLGLSNKLQPSSPPLTSPGGLPLFSSLGTTSSTATASTDSVQPAKPRQTGGLSAQDLSFFEGL